MAWRPTWQSGEYPHFDTVWPPLWKILASPMHLWIIHTTILDWILKKMQVGNRGSGCATCVKFMTLYEAFVVCLFSPCIPFCFSASYFGRIKEIIFVWKWIDTPKAKRFVYLYFFSCNASSTWWKCPIASSAADFKCWELGENKLIAVVCLFWLILV